MAPPTIRSRADIDASRRIPNARHPSTACSSGVPIGSLTVLASFASIRRRRPDLGKPRQHSVDQRRVREDPGGRVESLAAPGVAEHAAGLAHDQAGRGEVPDAAEHDDRRVERSLGDHRSVECEALASNRLGKVKQPRHRVAPPEQRPFPRDHDGRCIGERRLGAATQRFRRGDIERTVLCDTRRSTRPSPRIAHQRRPHNGAETMPNSTVPSTSSAMIVPQPGRPSA